MNHAHQWQILLAHFFSMNLRSRLLGEAVKFRFQFLLVHVLANIPVGPGMLLRPAPTQIARARKTRGERVYMSMDT